MMARRLDLQNPRPKLPPKRHRLLALSMGAFIGTLIAVLPSLPAQAAEPALAVVSPQPGPLERREIRAQLAPRRYTTLAAEIGAKIDRLPVPEGGSFKQGQSLIQFDCSLQQAQYDKARAAMGAAEKTLQANQRLAELNSAGKLELDISAAEVQKARAEVAAGSALLGKCRVPAPYPGRIAEQRVREQQYVQPGQALLDIIDDSALELEFIVPSLWLGWLKPGAAFQVHIDETGKTYPAKVQRIGARVDPVSQSIKINAVVDGKFPDLVAGMSGQVLMAPQAR